MKIAVVAGISLFSILALSACDEKAQDKQASAQGRNNPDLLQGRWICGDNVQVQFSGLNISSTITGTKMGDLTSTGSYDFLDGKFRIQFRSIRRTFSDPVQKAYAIRAIADSGDMLGAQTLLRDGYQDIPSNQLIISDILKLDGNSLVYQQIAEYRDGVQRPAVGAVQCLKTQ